MWSWPSGSTDLLLQAWAHSACRLVWQPCLLASLPFAAEALDSQGAPEQDWSFPTFCPLLSWSAFWGLQGCPITAGERKESH